MINPGTVAAIAASLMAQGENLGENSEFFSGNWAGQRDRRIRDFVSLAWRIAEETERQRAPHHAAQCAAHDLTNRRSTHDHAQPQDRQIPHPENAP